MMKKPKSAGAAAFLVILGCCLLLVLGSAAGAVLGYSEVSVTGYQPGPEGITYTGVVNWFKDTCRAFCTTEMPGQVRLKEANAAVERLAGKWIFQGTEVVRLNNGHLTSVGNMYYYQNPPEPKVADFRDYVENQLEADFLYVQAPCKICGEDPQLPMDDMCNANEEATLLLEGLEEAGGEGLDLRRSLHEDGLDHYGCFYRTDHHWTLPTGAWAARTIAGELNRRCGLEMDVSVLEEDRFAAQVWEDAFLGSWGRKVTLAYAPPEDFVMPVPKEPVRMRLTRYGVTYEGGFEALYDENQIVPEDYYAGSSYGAMLRGDCGYLKIENLDRPDGPVVAVLRESFAGAVGPYLSLAAGELHLLDARYYDGSLKELLAEIQPDAVVSLLNVQCYVNVYYDMVG